MSRCLNLAQTAAPLEKTTFVSSAPVMFTTAATWIIRCVQIQDTKSASLSRLHPHVLQPA